MNQDSEANSKDLKKCPKCATALHFVDDIGNHYCFECEEYFDEAMILVERDIDQPDAPPEEAVSEEDKAESPVCPSCGKPAEQIDETERFFCYGCEDYFTQGVPSAPEIDEPIESIPSEEPEMAEEGQQKEEARPAAPDTTATKVPDISNCGECGSTLRFIEKYGRYYCDLCKKYAPKDFKPEESKRCHSCGGEAIFIHKYGRWYCRACKLYLPKEHQKEDGATPEKKPEPEKVTAPSCANCGNPTRFIEKYGRYYCEKCKRYNPREGEDAGRAPSRAPSEGPVCSGCGKKTSYISKYDRFYCNDCKKYVPRKTNTQRVRTLKQKRDSGVPGCPECGQTTKFVDKYQRFYCYPCKKYLPKKD